jgi:trimeric autotransporter adhesin
MNTRILAILLIAGWGGSFRAQLHAQGTAFTYQGRLDNNDNPVNGSYDLRFAVFSTGAGGSALAGPLTNSAIAVSNGLFSIVLDFGPGIFTGADRWLEIGARPAGIGLFATVNPRQLLTPSPYAVHAGSVNAAGLVGAIPAANIAAASITPDKLTGVLLPSQVPNLDAVKITAGTIADVRLSANVSLLGPSIDSTEIADGAVTAAKIGSAQVVKSLNGLRDAVTFSAGPNITLTPSGNSIQIAGTGGGGGWSLTGNSGTMASTQFLGTTDSQPLELKVNNERVLRLELNTNGSPNVIGGAHGNFVGPGVVGATIGGGGEMPFRTNIVLADFGVIGGGRRNELQFSAFAATISGGHDNVIQTNADIATISGGGRNTIFTNSIGATISGGELNEIRASSRSSAIGGGVFNDIGESASEATIAGGYRNEILPNGDYAMIPGGDSNTATNYAFAAGRRAKAIHTGAFVWADPEFGDFVSTGTNQFLIRARGGVGIGLNAPQSALHVAGTVTATAFNPPSDRNLKENFAPVRPRDVLSKVAALPITRWTFKGDHTTPHLGPMAQDFHAAFGLGTDDKHIATVDADGVALAAIQGLNQKLEEKDAEIQQLRQSLAELKALVEKVSLLRGEIK